MEGRLAHGRGEVTLTSGALPDFPVTWASRTVQSDGLTGPEELIAAAHASCFSMAFSNDLAEAGTPPDRLKVSAAATLDLIDVGLRITTMDLDARGWIPGIDAAAFEAAAVAAKNGCPVSNALTGVDIRIRAHLEG